MPEEPVELPKLPVPRCRWCKESICDGTECSFRPRQIPWESPVVARRNIEITRPGFKIQDIDYSGLEMRLYADIAAWVKRTRRKQLRARSRRLKLKRGW